MLNNFSYRLSFTAEDPGRHPRQLLALLRMLFENIAALTLDDQGLHGQVEALIAASTPPLTLRRLDDVQRRLKDVIVKQSQAKDRLLEAQDQMKECWRPSSSGWPTWTNPAAPTTPRWKACAERIGQATQLQEIHAAAAGGDDRHARHRPGKPGDARRTAPPARALRGRPCPRSPSCSRRCTKPGPGAARPHDRLAQPQGGWTR